MPRKRVSTKSLRINVSVRDVRIKTVQWIITCSSFHSTNIHLCLIYSEHHAFFCCLVTVVSNQLFCNPMDCSPPGSFVRGISQARLLEWVAISFSRGSSWPRDRTHSSCHVSCIRGRFCTTGAGKTEINYLCTCLQVPSSWGRSRSYSHLQEEF